MEQEIELDLFLENRLFQGISKTELLPLYQISTRVQIGPDQYLIREGETTKDIFFVLSGTFKVLKYDPAAQQSHTIGLIEPKDAIGEMALLDSGPRSASVLSVTHSRLRKISFSDLLQAMQKTPELNLLFLHLASNVSRRLRQASELAFDALKAKAEEYKTRNHMGYYLVIMFTILSVTAFSIPSLREFFHETSNTSYVTIPLLSILVATMFISNHWFQFPYSTFGLTLQNWKRAVLEGIFFTIPLMGLLVGLKWFLIQNQGVPLFNPYFLFPNPELQTVKTWIVFQLFYVLFIPLQELTARGGVQSVLEKFLAGKYKVPLSIGMSSLVFSTFHLFLSGPVGVAAFLAGLYFGWLFSRTHNLLSPVIAHLLIGVWGLSILGM